MGYRHVEAIYASLQTDKNPTTNTLTESENRAGAASHGDPLSSAQERLDLAIVQRLDRMSACDGI